jgi:hypothetical protein
MEAMFTNGDLHIGIHESKPLTQAQRMAFIAIFLPYSLQRLPYRQSYSEGIGCVLSASLLQGVQVAGKGRLVAFLQ